MQMIGLFFITTVVSTIMFGIVTILTPDPYFDGTGAQKSTSIHDFSVQANLILSIATSVVFFLIISTWLIISYYKYISKINR